MDVTPGIRREPPPDTESVGQDDELVALIRDEIRARGPITFARFMALALYDAERGYYRSNRARPGREGDFLTAPEAHPIFGWALARAVADAWQALDRPRRFSVREYGSGTGALALAIVARLQLEEPELTARLRYQAIEIDERRIATLAWRFEDAGLADSLLPARPDEPDPVDGIVLANEVVDALPTHRVVMRSGLLREILVGWSDGRLVDIEAEPSSPALGDRLAEEGVALADGQRAEICLDVDTFVAGATTGLERGLLLVIDYGHPARELYDVNRRRDGTLRAYLRHTVHDDPYRHVGRQDLTAHVDVTAVESAARRADLSHLGTTTQGEFLAGLGAGDLLHELGQDPATTIEEYLTARSALLRMIDPAAMGRFRVMAFGRRWPDGRSLLGLDVRIGR